MNDQPPSRGRARGHLEIHSLIPRARFRKEFLLACANHAARRIPSAVGQVNFIVVNDREMARLHREFMAIRGTTDVLTFDLSDARRSVVEGDIYICLDQARRQAREYRVPLYMEMARLAVHGVLHLAGYDDTTDALRMNMKRLEDRSLQAVREA